MCILYDNVLLLKSSLLVYMYMWCVCTCIFTDDCTLYSTCTVHVGSCTFTNGYQKYNLGYACTWWVIHVLIL